MDLAVQCPDMDILAIFQMQIGRYVGELYRWCKLFVKLAVLENIFLIYATFLREDLKAILKINLKSVFVFCSAVNSVESKVSIFNQKLN